MALVHFARHQGAPSVHVRVPGTTAGRAVLDLVVRSVHTAFRAEATHAQTYTNATEALRGLDRGYVIALGAPDDVRRWFAELGQRPQLSLLTVSGCALPLLATDVVRAPQARRFHYPSLRDGGDGSPDSAPDPEESEAWHYGRLVGHLATGVLTRSGYASWSYTEPEHLLRAWYKASVVTEKGYLTLGPFFNGNCSYDGDVRCRCNQGARAVAIVAASDHNTPYVYRCGPECQIGCS